MSSAKLSQSDIASMKPADFRKIVRQGKWKRHAIYACNGYARFNLVVVPEDIAFEFLLFSQRNPQACAVTAVTEPGNPHPSLLAAKADLRTDLPKYRVFKDGKIIDEPDNILKYWSNDLVAFFIGAVFNTFTCFDDARVHYHFVGAYSTNIRCVPAGRFSGKMPVSCALLENSHDAVRAIQISSRFPVGHGSPVHIGDPSVIGIKDFYHPDIFSLGPIAQREPNEIAMFWGEGVTPQTVALEAKIPFMITHKPAHFFISDRQVTEFAIF